MTDDQLDRALRDLSLTPLPAGLHARILNATVHRPRLMMRAWETSLMGVLVALTVWLAILVVTSSPDGSTRLIHGFAGGLERFIAALDPRTMIWMAVGISSAFWISQLSLHHPLKQTADH